MTDKTYGSKLSGFPAFVVVSTFLTLVVIGAGVLLGHLLTLVKWSMG